VVPITPEPKPEPAPEPEAKKQEAAPESLSELEDALDSLFD